MTRPTPIAKNPNVSYLKWNFDVKTFSLLGSELITDRITALVELAKNAYDANATRLDITFTETTSTGSPLSQIEIMDDGEGMSSEDISNKWMVIGTNSKRTNKFSDLPFNRRLIGEKGVGRFAVEKLGNTLLLKTKKKGASFWLHLEIDWKKYSDIADKADGTFFTDIPNKFWKTKGDKNDSGTTLSISGLNDVWSEHDIERAQKELSKIVSPLKQIYPPFDIYICNANESNKSQKVVNHAITFATIERHINYGKDFQEVLSVSDGVLGIKKEPIKSFGPIALHLFFFNQEDKSRFSRAYKGTFIQIDGFKVYRDGIITTPFAQHEDSPDKKRDILGIDKRRWSGFFEKISSRDLIGFVEITRDKNPRIVDATNRQDFLDNLQYRDFKEFIIAQLLEVEKFLKLEKKKTGEQIVEELKEAKENLSDFSSTIKELADRNPSISQELKQLSKQAKKVQISIKKGIKTQNDLKKESVRKENLYLSLMSLQEYSVHLAHAVRTAISKIKSYAEFFKKEFPNPTYEKHFKKYSLSIYDEMLRLDSAVNFMLSYASSNVDFAEFNLKEVIVDLFSAHKPIFESEHIQVDLEIKDPVLLFHNRKFVDDIFENLISNSVKALKGTEEKKIKCSGYADTDKYIIFFSDNGVGIPPENQNKVFEVYFTTTAADGGAGVGLYIVKTRVEALRGSISIINSEFVPYGVTFRLEIPFKQEDA